MCPKVICYLVFVKTTLVALAGNTAYGLSIQCVKCILHTLKRKSIFLLNSKETLCFQGYIKLEHLRIAGKNISKRDRITTYWS